MFSIPFRRAFRRLWFDSMAGKVEESFRSNPLESCVAAESEKRAVKTTR
jgi:hypothetical protein